MPEFDTAPLLVTIDGREWWQWPDGSLLPVIRGADDGDGDGGNDDDDDGDDNDSDDDNDDDDGDESKWPESARKIVSKERQAARDARREARRATRELERLKSGKGGKDKPDEDAINAARKEGEKEALERANARILRSEVKAIAAGILNDPSDAVRLLDLDDFEVDEDGEVDAKAIKAAIKDLVKEKPYLKAEGGSSGGKGGSGDGGVRKPAGSGVSMNDRIRAAAGRRVDID